MTDSIVPTAVFFEPSAPIKLVIWDMDDTFWHGTLSEGGARLNPATIAIVRELVDRGIMSSISSKNDFAAVQEVLTSAGIWDLFIFPQISWGSKGGAVETILTHANLRPDNILFIDDNSLNLEEIRFRFPTMMVAHPDEVLGGLLDLPEAKGKDDRGHSRLQQYKQLQQKVSEQASATLSNEDFLRQSDARLRFDVDVESHFERIVELVNRSNQLNYTKVRLESDEAIAAFRADLRRHDILSAAIFAKDRYGDHGLIGFYMQHKNEQTNRLLHYVWSCRMMNAGLEQYVYERLGRPAIDVAEPVANPIVCFDRIDWIREVASDDAEATDSPARRLLLIGSCDLTAVASYCSPDRAEYVNGIKNGIMTRYDDLGFILSDPAKVAASVAIDRLPAWSKADFAAFHADLASSEVLIVSLAAVMKGAHAVTPEGVVVRIHPDGLGDYLDAHPWSGFLDGCSVHALDTGQKAELLRRALAVLRARVATGARVFLLGANTRDAGAPLTAANRALLTLYNEICEAFCAESAGWHFVSIDAIVSEDKLVDDRHYTRIGYFDIAAYINGHVDDAAEPATAPVRRDLAPFDAGAFVRGGRRLTRFSIFGPERPGQGVVALSRRVLNRGVKRVFAKAG